MSRSTEFSFRRSTDLLRSATVAALGLTVAVFVYWLVVGFAVVSVALKTPSAVVRNLLLAPSIGVASTVLPVFLLNRAGLPVGRAGIPLLIVTLLVSATALWRMRARVPVRAAAPFAVVLLAALWLVARPMLDFGFDWLSYGNDDMANYALGAQFFVEHAFPNTPSLATLLQGSDYTQYYWYFFVPHGVRPGSELLLAWVASVTGLSVHQIFMPTVVALHLSLISAAAGLIYQCRRYQSAALVVAGLLSISALTTLATLSQLIAQVDGLALLATTASLLRMQRTEGWRQLAAHALLLGIVGTALGLIYPEVIPFLGAAVVVEVGVGLVRRRAEMRHMIAIVSGAAVTGIVLLNFYLADVFVFLSFQVSSGVRKSDPDTLLFPYFLIPSGMADLWGFQIISVLAADPWLTLSIAVGGLLLVIATVCVAITTWRGQPGAALSAVMLALGARLFAVEADFGLFKLAMFLQPFILGQLVLVASPFRRRTVWRLAPALVAGVVGLTGQFAYVEQSRSPFNEIFNGSQSRLNSQFKDLINTGQPGRIALDTNNIVIAKLQALYTQGHDTTFLSRDFFTYLIGYSLDARFLIPGAFELTRSARDAVQERFPAAFFVLHDPNDPLATNEFRVNTLGVDDGGAETCDTFIADPGTQSVLNRWYFRDTGQADFVKMPCSSVQNWLVFIHSKLGQNYFQLDPKYFGDGPSGVGIYRLENDPLLVGRSMSAAGRYLLFQVVQPSSSVRMMLEITDTLAGDGVNQLPPAAAIGSSREVFPIRGRGAARVFSPPFVPQTIDGRQYVGMDMGVDGRRFAEQRVGLMGLYGTDLPLDRRLTVGFARNISVVSDDTFKRLTPPSAVEHFPSDLENQSLQFSGLYEDGWVAESAFLDLDQPAGADRVSVHGVVPSIDDPAFTTTLTVLVDGAQITRRELSPGEFNISAPIQAGTGTRRVELAFSATQTLPRPDGRPAAALLQQVSLSGT